MVKFWMRRFTSLFTCLLMRWFDGLGSLEKEKNGNCIPQHLPHTPVPSWEPAPVLSNYEAVTVWLESNPYSTTTKPWILGGGDPHHLPAPPPPSTNPSWAKSTLFPFPLLAAPINHHQRSMQTPKVILNENQVPLPRQISRLKRLKAEPKYRKYQKREKKGMFSELINHNHSCSISPGSPTSVTRLA